MKKNDYIILALASIYIILLPLVPTEPSTKYEWALLLLFAIIGLIYLAELIAHKDMRKEFAGSFKAVVLDKFSILFIVLIAIMLVSTFYSRDKIVSLKGSARFIYYLVVYFLLRFRFNKKPMFELLIKVYLFSTLIVGVLGIYDFFINYNKGDIMYILNNARVKSTLPHPNAYGAYLILAIFPTLTIALQSKGKERISYLVLSILLSINLALTFSRNGWLALAIGILLLTVVYNWKFIFLCIIPAAYVAISPAILTRIRQLSDSGLNEGRLRLWKMSEKMISENLFFGVGSGNFPAAYKDYVKRFPELKIVEAETLPPHNSYIRAFSELGIFGAMIFLLLCLEMLKTVYSIKDKFSGIIQKFYSGYLISVVCFFIMNCFDDLFFSPKVTFNFMFFVSMAYSIKATKEENEENTLESANLI